MSTRDHFCFEWTIYDNIDGPEGPFIFGLARPLMYPDQKFHDSAKETKNKILGPLKIVALRYVINNDLIATFGMQFQYVG